MATARDFVTLAMKEAGVIGIGQSPNSEDINDCFTLLQRMLAQWQQRRWIVPSLIDVAGLGNNAQFNFIGPGQHYNAARPDKIQAAYFNQLGSGSNNVSYPLSPIWSYEDYSRIALKDLNSWPTYYFYDNSFPLGKVFIWPIPTSAYEIHLITKGPIGFNIQLEAGSIENGGLLYTDGSYSDIPFVDISSLGSQGTADVTIAGGIVTAIAIHTPGDGYKINDFLTLDNTLMGGTGSGCLWRVTDVTDSLDAEFNMPPEYEEAIHYNLCVRITSMYQYDPNPVQGTLAKLALNTIKNSNTQISKLQMPKSLRFGGNGGAGFYLFNADNY